MICCAEISTAGFSTNHVTPSVQGGAGFARLKPGTSMQQVGGIIGLAGAVGLGKAASSLLFGLKGTDPVVFALSLVVLTFVALGAGYLPARRASRVDPIQALRYE